MAETLPLRYMIHTTNVLSKSHRSVSSHLGRTSRSLDSGQEEGNYTGHASLLIRPCSPVQAGAAPP